MESKRFPNLIHVVLEDSGDGDKFLAVSEEGVFNPNLFDETRQCAIYKRISVGRVEVLRRFVTGKRKK